MTILPQTKKAGKDMTGHSEDLGNMKNALFVKSWSVKDLKNANVTFVTDIINGSDWIWHG